MDAVHAADARSARPVAGWLVVRSVRDHAVTNSTVVLLALLVLRPLRFA
jgi:hypothetical protein